MPPTWRASRWLGSRSSTRACETAALAHRGGLHRIACRAQHRAGRGRARTAAFRRRRLAHRMARPFPGGLRPARAFPRHRSAVVHGTRVDRHADGAGPGAARARPHRTHGAREPRLARPGSGGGAAGGRGERGTRAGHQRPPRGGIAPPPRGRGPLRGRAPVRRRGPRQHDRSVLPGFLGPLHPALERGALERHRLHRRRNRDHEPGRLHLAARPRTGRRWHPAGLRARPRDDDRSRNRRPRRQRAPLLAQRQAGEPGRARLHDRHRARHHAAQAHRAADASRQGAPGPGAHELQPRALGLGLQESQGLLQRELGGAPRRSPARIDLRRRRGPGLEPPRRPRGVASPPSATP